MEWTDELREIIKPGNRVRTYPQYYPNPHRSYLYHILAIVDEDRIVVKRWSKIKFAWLYDVIWIYEFRLMWEDGDLKQVI